MREQISKRAEAERQPVTDLDLPIEAVFCSNHLAQHAEGHPAPGGDVEHRQGIVGTEEEAFMHLGVLAKMQEHPEPIGQGEGGDVGIEVLVIPGKCVESRQEFLVQHQPVAAGVGGDDRCAFIQGEAESIGVAEGLVFPDEAELVADVTQERQLPIGEGSVERFVARISRVELLRVWEDLHQCGAAIGATMDFFDCIPSLRIDRDAGEEFIRVGPRGLEHIVVADQEIRMGLIEAAVLVIDPIHAEDHGFLDVT